MKRCGSPISLISSTGHTQVTVNGLVTGAAGEPKEHYERVAPAQEEKAQEEEGREERRSFLSLTDQPMAKDSIRGRTT